MIQVIENALNKFIRDNKPNLTGRFKLVSSEKMISKILFDELVLYYNTKDNNAHIIYTLQRYHKEDNTPYLLEENMLVEVFKFIEQDNFIEYETTKV